MSTTLLPPLRHRPRLLGLLSSTDHKHGGLLVCGVAFVFFCMGGLLAVLMRSELSAPDMQVISQETYNQVFTIHGSTTFYLFGVPMTLGFGLYLVPLQIGAGGLRWPRLALLGLWIFIGAGLLMYAGFLAELLPAARTRRAGAHHHRGQQRRHQCGGPRRTGAPARERTGRRSPVALARSSLPHVVLGSVPLRQLPQLILRYLASVDPGAVPARRVDRRSGAGMVLRRDDPPALAAAARAHTGRREDRRDRHGRRQGGRRGRAARPGRPGSPTGWPTCSRAYWSTISSPTCAGWPG